MSAPSIKPLNETNYEEWALAAMACLQNTGYWGYVEGIELPPLKPFAPVATGTNTKLPTTVPPNQPESNDPTYLSQFYRYYERYQQYTSNLVKASGAIRTLLDPALQRKYADTAYTTDPKRVWEDIKKERERVFAIDGRQLRERLTSIRYVDFSSGMKYFTEIRHIAEQLKICDDVVSESMQAFHMMRGFPKTAEWTAFKNTLNMTKNDTKPDDILKHLEVFESTLREGHGVPQDVALFENEAISMITTETEDRSRRTSRIRIEPITRRRKSPAMVAERRDTRRISVVAESSGTRRMTPADGTMQVQRKNQLPTLQPRKLRICSSSLEKE